MACALALTQRTCRERIVYVADVRTVGFRSYAEARFSFSDGLNVIAGANASGKTNLVEAAYWALRGTSPRTTRDDKLVRWGGEFARVELTLGNGTRVATAYSAGTGRRSTVDGVEAASLQELRRLGPAFIFVPESLLLVKGGPARRRAHVDVFGGGLDVAYAAAAGNLQTAVRQRNAQLARVRAGAAEQALDPWDAQLASSGLELERRRGALIASLAEPFARYAAALAPAGGDYRLALRSSLDEIGDDEAAYREALLARRRREVQSGLSALGPHRDDIEISEQLADGRRRELRLFGSQGEQRAAVLALLLAEREVAAARTGERGPLFLDDVMSELDHDRRRLLVASLAGSGQAIVTTTTTMYFTPEELREANIIRLGPDEDAVAEVRPLTLEEPA
jgi:DNA replication and repair protein RecF